MSYTSGVNKQRARTACALLLTTLAIGSGVARAEETAFAFDGTASPGEIFVKDGGVQPTFVAGRQGQAILIGARSVVALPFDVDPRDHPQLTVSVWLKVGTDSVGQARIFSPGEHANLPVVSISNRHVGVDGRRADGTGNLRSDTQIPLDTWVPVAVVWDYDARSIRIQVGQQEVKKFENLQMDVATGQVQKQMLYVAPNAPADAEKQPYVFIGARNFTNYGAAASGVAIDDLRLFTRALSETEIAALGTTSPMATPTEATASAEPSPSPAGIKMPVVEATVPGYFQAPTGSATPSVTGTQLPSAPTVSVSPTQVVEAPVVPTIEQTTGSSSGGQAALPTSPSLPTGVTQSLEGSRIAVPEKTTQGTGGETTFATSPTLSEEQQQAIQQQLTATTIPQKGALTEAEQAATQPASQQTATESSSGERKVVGWRLSATDVKRTAVSGESGQIIRHAELPLDNRGMHHIEIDEENNVPCFVDISEGGLTQIGECDWALSIGQKLQADIGNAVITALSVCSTNTDNKRVKGIEIRGSAIKGDGSLGAYQQDADQHSNCAQWRSIVLCDDEYIGTGVAAHFNVRSGSEELVGLQLICRRIDKVYGQ